MAPQRPAPSEQHQLLPILEAASNVSSSSTLVVLAFCIQNHLFPRLIWTLGKKPFTVLPAGLPGDLTALPLPGELGPQLLHKEAGVRLGVT